MATEGNVQSIRVAAWIEKQTQDASPVVVEPLTNSAGESFAKLSIGSAGGDILHHTVNQVFREGDSDAVHIQEILPHVSNKENFCVVAIDSPGGCLASCVETALRATVLSLVDLHEGALRLSAVSLRNKEVYDLLGAEESSKKMDVEKLEPTEVLLRSASNATAVLSTMVAAFNKIVTTQSLHTIVTVEAMSENGDNIDFVLTFANILRAPSDDNPADDVKFLESKLKTHFRRTTNPQSVVSAGHRTSFVSRVFKRVVGDSTSEFADPPLIEMLETKIQDASNMFVLLSVDPIHPETVDGLRVVDSILFADAPQPTETSTQQNAGSTAPSNHNDDQNDNNNNNSDNDSDNNNASDDDANDNNGSTRSKVEPATTEPESNDASLVDQGKDVAGALLDAANAMFKRNDQGISQQQHIEKLRAQLEKAKRRRDEMVGRLTQQEKMHKIELSNIYQSHSRALGALELTHSKTMKQLNSEIYGPSTLSFDGASHNLPRLGNVAQSQAFTPIRNGDHSHPRKPWESAAFA